MNLGYKSPSRPVRALCKGNRVPRTGWSDIRRESWKSPIEKGGRATVHQVIAPKGKRCGNCGMEEKRLHSLTKGA
ncbi:UNVERIFIED_CONTAM: hypothetical protein FKN15_025813 [Acipenser sinensis]